MEDFDFKVQQVLEELERMQPDIDNEVDAKFAARVQDMNNNQAGVWGNIQAANMDNDAPEISRGNINQIVRNFQEQQSQLEGEVNEFRNEQVNLRANFLIDQYYEDASNDEKSSILEAVQNALEQASQDKPLEANPEKGDYFEAEDFAFVEDSSVDNSLSESFDAAAFPDPPTPPSKGGGIET